MNHADDHAIDDSVFRDGPFTGVGPFAAHDGPYAAFVAPRYVRHKPRPDGLRCTDESKWLVLEDSPSFYIVFLPGEGVSLKRKADYEVVT